MEPAQATQHGGEPQVACLDIRESAYDYDGRDSDWCDEVRVYANEDFHMGRCSSNGIASFSDPTISNRHLKFHSILYDDDPRWGVQPLVYAEDRSSNGTYLQRANAPKADQTDPRGICMGTNVKVTLLEDKDELWLTPRVFLRYHILEAFKTASPPFAPAVDIDIRAFQERYNVMNRRIGGGGQGTVYVAIHRKSHRQLACKIVDLTAADHHNEKVRRYLLEHLCRECDVLKDLDHPNIIRLEKVFCSDTSVFIFQDLITGGDLFSYIDRRGRKIPTIEGAVILRQVLRGVEYLHDRNIVHRDLKPDNILLTSTSTGARIVITDFGSARYLPPTSAAPEPKATVSKRMFSQVGTLEYAAPEIFRVNQRIPANSGYSKAVDMWSIGCIAAALLSGDVIFIDRCHPDFDKHPKAVIMNLANKNDLSILDTDPAWQQVGHRAKDFIRRSLVLDETERMTVKEALAHPWFSNINHADLFDAVYRRAIRDWKPRRKRFRLIESIETKPEKMQLNRSQFFPPPSPTYPSVPMADIISKPQLPSIPEEPEEEPGTSDANSAQPTPQPDKESSVREANSPKPSPFGSYLSTTMLSPPSPLEDTIQQDMTQLSLLGHNESELTPPVKRQPSFDYDDLDDNDLLSAMHIDDNSQPACKRLRTV